MPTPNNWLVVTSNAVPDTVMVSSVEIIAPPPVQLNASSALPGASERGGMGCFGIILSEFVFRFFRIFDCSFRHQQICDTSLGSRDIAIQIF